MGSEMCIRDRIYRLSPVLHLNETEALSASGKSNIQDAAAFLYTQTNNTVIITLGEKGCFFFDGKESDTISPVPAVQADTIGAGDSHIGSVIACLKKGYSLRTAIQKANRVSSAVVSSSGALLSDNAFDKLGLL